MCIFSVEPSRVSKTRIFVTPIGDGKQFTAYANSVTVDGKSTAMILPFPSYNKEGCVPVDMSKCSKFFDDLDKIFPQPLLNSVETNSRSAPSQTTQMLAVFEVGSYKCSVATCFEDLSRVQSDAFGISSEGHGLPERIKTELAQHYGTDFGFLICKIDDSADFSPIGYTSSMLKESLFIPTRHDHGDGKVPKWDHKIYLVGVDNKSVVSLGGSAFPRATITHASTNQISKYVNSQVFNLTMPDTLETKSIQKWEIYGTKHENDDLVANCISNVKSTFTPDPSSVSGTSSGSSRPPSTSSSKNCVCM